MERSAAERTRRRETVESIRKEQLDALIVCQAENIRYLTGFSGSSGLLYAGADGSLDFITDSRYKEQFMQEAEGCRLTVVSGNRCLDAVVALGIDQGHARIGFESRTLTYSDYVRVKDGLDGRGQLVASDGMIESLRSVKDDYELVKLRSVIELTVEVYEETAETLRPGMLEREVAADLEFRFRKKGAQKTAFQPIVASGERSALPHAIASGRPIGKGEFVVIDIGCTMDGYASDMTRTVFVGEPDERAKSIYETVRNAQEAALNAIRPGVTGSSIDKAARDVIERNGFGEYFDHGTGHGIGLSVHEAPQLAREADDRLEENMVVTVEPGIYIPGYGGVRIEDVVQVTADGARLLTLSSSELLAINNV